MEWISLDMFDAFLLSTKSHTSLIQISELNPSSINSQLFMYNASFRFFLVDRDERWTDGWDTCILTGLGFLVHVHVHVLLLLLVLLCP